tara:strand:+ start:6447 stop:7481 length:1035 start_codon:yes stop_codon:yes gene_type:complete
MALNINGTTGISGVDGSASAPVLQGTDSNTGISFGSDIVNINTGGTTRATIESNGRFGIGVQSPDDVLAVRGSNGSGIRVSDSTANVLVGTGSGPVGRLITITNHDLILGTNDSEKLRINTSGDITNTTSRTQGQTFVNFTGSGTSNFSLMVFGANSGGHNTAGCAIAMGKNSDTSRSLNAGGSVNASGNDYAEYMTKSSDFTIAKGDICGINADGKLTNKFSESITFVVKSTNPSYVGGDTWGTQEILGEKPSDDSSDLTAYQEKYETARNMVDRIAFSGQVPVNVTGATAGQHIIPIVGSDDSIKGIAKTEKDLSMAEYISSVGKVITLESDGRAKIIVKVC